MSKDGQSNWDYSIQGFTMQGHDDVIPPDFWVGLGLQNMYALRLHKRPHNSLRWEHIRNQYVRYGFSKPDVRYQDWGTFPPQRTSSTKRFPPSRPLKENPTSAPHNSRRPMASLRTCIHSFHAYIASIYNILNL